MQLREIMTSSVVTALPKTSARDVARQMRDHNVGSVVVTEPDGNPVAMITDRDIATRVLADGQDPADPVALTATRPWVCGEPALERGEAAARMVQPSVRRRPGVEGGELAGIVTLDDIAVRTGNLALAQRMTQEVIEGAIPQFFFHERG